MSADSGSNKTRTRKGAEGRQRRAAKNGSSARAQARSQGSRAARMRREIGGVGLVILGLISGGALAHQPLGPVGLGLDFFLRGALGTAAWLCPLALIFGGWAAVARKRRRSAGRPWGVLLLVISLSGAFELRVTRSPMEAATAGNGGGLVGAALDWGLREGFGAYGAAILLVGLGLVGIVLATGLALGPLVEKLNNLVSAYWRALKGSLADFFVQDELEEPYRETRSQASPDGSVSGTLATGSDQGEEVAATAARGVELTPERTASTVLGRDDLGQTLAHEQPVIQPHLPLHLLEASRSEPMAGSAVVVGSGGPSATKGDVAAFVTVLHQSGATRQRGADLAQQARGICALRGDGVKPTDHCCSPPSASSRAQNSRSGMNWPMPGRKPAWRV